MSKKLASPNDSLQQSTTYQSTAYPSTQSRDRPSLDATNFGSSRKFLNGNASIGGGTYKSYIMDHQSRMRSDIEATTRKLELEQRRLYKLDKELGMAESEYAQKRQRSKLYQTAQDDAVNHNVQEKRVLERRLEKAIADLNKGTCENEQLREQIDQLRKERLILDTMFRQLERGIKEKGRTIERVKTSMNEDKLSCEEAKQKNRAVTKIIQRERRKFQKECTRLKLEVRNQSDVQKEQEKLARSGDTSAPKDGGGKGKNKKTYMVADEEEAFSEQLMHRRILKLSFLNTIQRRHIKQHQKNIEVFEQAFATIKSSTGIHEIEEIVKIFVGLEQRNFSLLTYVNQLNREIESIEIRNRDLQNQLKNYQLEQNDSAARKNDALSELLQQITKTKTATEEKDKMIGDAAAALSECRPVIWSITKYLKQEIPPLVHQGYEGDVPPMKSPPPDEHEENLNMFLMYVEEALMQFRVCLPSENRRPLDLPQPKVPVGSKDAPGMKKPLASELPSAHITGGDDSDDDPETGFGERPLPRNELRERAQAMIQRRKKKPGQAGKGAHEQKGGGEGTEDAPAEPSTRRDNNMAPPAAREYAASSASKDSGGDNAHISKSPSMTGKPVNDGTGTAPVAGEDSYREEMNWRKEKKR